MPRSTQQEAARCKPYTKVRYEELLDLIRTSAAPVGRRELQIDGATPRGRDSGRDSGVVRTKLANQLHVFRNDSLNLVARSY